MKYTLLELTQMILSSMDSDEVNSINDTVESQQVVNVIKTCYGDIFSRSNLPENYTLFNLTASGDATKPTLMFLPETTVTNCLWVRYNCQRADEIDSRFLPVCHVPLSEFLYRMHAHVPAQGPRLIKFTHIVDGTNIEFIADSSIAPTFYTSWDDKAFIFNSYDSEVDTTLQSSKTMAYGEKQPPWITSNTFVPPIDDHQLLLHESKALAWMEIRQMQHPRAERGARQQWVHLQRTKHKILDGDDYFTTTPNYGRKC
jgi:hypothetical protein